MSSRLRHLRKPLLPDRVRSIGEDGFAFIPYRFFKDGYIASLAHDELALYVFLVLAGNRAGVSFYGHDAICSMLRMRLDDYIGARNRLIELDFIAFDGTRFQVLSLPAAPNPHEARPLKSEQDFERADPATIRAALLDALDSD